MLIFDSRLVKKNITKLHMSCFVCTSILHIVYVLYSVSKKKTSANIKVEGTYIF